ncbi:hypothetical protein B0H13DRAFT_2353680 [Mycena leptocephala]|nr:hypothetical protein B0H13DRAFT_2353680 [Mycena leptocephala]
MCAFLASFWIYYGPAALVNVTIEDSSPLVQYNCTVLKCDADTANTNPCGLTGFNDRTLTLTATGTACEITIPFSGAAVYAFVACASFRNCEFEIDNNGVHANLEPTNNVATDVGLSYYNTSLPNGAHTLVITTTNAMTFDSVLYTFDDAVTQVAAQPASSTTSGSTSSASSPPTDLPQTNSPVSTSALKKSTPLSAIVGGVLGGLLIAILAALIAVFFKRRSGHNNAMLWRTSPGEPDPPPNAGVAESAPRGHDDAAFTTEQISLLQAALQTLRAERIPSGSAITRPADQVPSARTRSAIKRGRTSAAQEQSPTSPVAVADSVSMSTNTGTEQRLERERQMEELPPHYSVVYPRRE